MTAAPSAGLLVWRRGPAGPEILLAHPGGPYWRGKDAAAWSIPSPQVPQPAAERAAVDQFFAETADDGELDSESD